MTYSVLMSVYKNDSPEFLKLALESIYDNQTRKPDEVVVVFDGPITDELYTVLQDFQQGKEDIVKYYPQEINRGLGEALRIGSEKCTGDYILRMDSDDISDSLRFEKQMAYVEKHPEIDVVGTDIAEFQKSPAETNKRIRACPANHEDVVRMSKKRNPMNHVTVCIKKTALEKAGGYQTLLLLEDYYLWLNMIINGCRLANINEPLVFVRIGNGFNSKRGSKERIKGWKIIQNLMVRHGMISKFQAKLNMVYIWGFVKTPSFIKKILYNKFLRKGRV
jgi:glycosyltransferase involved in cell wall biosynthesis